MKNQKTKRTVIRTEEKRDGGYIYKYSLSMKESSRVASYGLPLYSVSVELTDLNGNVSNADTLDIFADIGKALSFFEMLSRNLVTPIDLPYIVEDEISV